MELWSARPVGRQKKRLNTEIQPPLTDTQLGFTGVVPIRFAVVR